MRLSGFFRRFALGAFLALLAVAQAPAGVAEPVAGSPVEIYASRNGVKFDGSDQSAALQAICNRGQSGPIRIVLDGSAIKLKGVNLYSGTTIEGLGYSTVVTQATATGFGDGYVFGNAHYRSPYQGGQIVDQNITVKNMYIDGNYRNGSSGTASRATADGTGVTHLRFLGVTNLRVESVYIYDTVNYAVWLGNVFNAVIRDVTSIVPGALSGWDISLVSTAAVQVEGPASDLLIENIYGSNGDDFIALNAVDGHLISGLPVPADLYYGSISRVIIRGLHPVATANIVRFLSGAAEGGAQATIDQVLVEDVVGSTYQTLFLNQAIDGLGTPSTGNVVLRNWTVGFLSSTGENGRNILSGSTGSFTLTGFRLSNRTTNTGPLVELDSGASVGRLALTDFALREDSGEVSTNQPIVSIAAGTVDELVLSGVSVARNAVTAAAIVAVSAGTVNRIELAGVSGINVNNIVAVSGGTVGGINSTGLTHRGANANASIAQTGGTLSRLRAGSSDTTLLASGTIASKKTDGTEDS
jgi:hypothetical protein